MFKGKKRVNRYIPAEVEVYREDDLEHRLDKDYPYRLNFYLKPPLVEITLDEFEQYALDRLQVLRAIETASLRNKRGPELKHEMYTVTEKYLPLSSNLSKSTELYQQRRKDDISHFILRLAYCRSEDLREWFLRQETALFKYRFDTEPLDMKRRFLKHLNLSWKILSTEEKNAMAKELEICCKNISAESGMTPLAFVQSEIFFEVDFEKVPELIKQRQVYLVRGKAYIPMLNQVDLILSEFKDRLRQKLEMAAKMLPRMEEDDRLKPILLNIEKQYIGKNYTEDMNVTGDIKADAVDTIIQQHAPLCMKNLHEALRSDRHLKHGGRLQYGLFLKGLGLSVEEALIFWRTAFSDMTEDKFQKGYSYHVRYNYGLEGRRVDYKPYSCIKIISGNSPSTGDHHGCPFAHIPEENLQTRLMRERLSSSQIHDITHLVKGQHYQLACTKYFEITHPTAEKVPVIEHPNQYVELSMAASAAAASTSVDITMTESEILEDM
ncbi:DNA primase large subunit Spp2 [Pilobolus umbonatus]|nr:DNA primase large subunit Spp2 [Pilobolus umbonatus]